MAYASSNLTITCQKNHRDAISAPHWESSPSYSAGCSHLQAIAGETDDT